MKKRLNKAPVRKSAVKKKEPVSKARTKKTVSKSFPIIGMGGSAGSFPAFEQFFTHMPADSGMAFVIIVHLDPEHKGNLSALIQNYTPIPVLEAKDGTVVHADHIYVIPANKDMGIHNRKLLLLPQARPKGFRMPIDYFFQSLAEDQWSKAVGIIFSGMGSDGETGLRMIKEKLGMAMVQDPASAQYDSMPNSALSTNLVDYMMSPEEMPLRLIQYLKHPALSDDLKEPSILDARNQQSTHKILMMLRSQTGHDFSLYKKNTITRRIDRRIAFHQLADYSKYVNYLRENPHEINILFNELLIGVTKFFRDKDAFDSLKVRLTKVFRAKDDKEPIRVWVAGCSTGEEAYSISIIIAEYLEMFPGRKPKVQIFATDLDLDAIDHARQGIYLENIVADVSPERIEKYFIKKQEGYQVKKELREMIVFAQHNLIKDAPFTRLDLLSCRNLMIYLNTELQKRLMPIFHYSLAPKGLLLLGPAETVGGFTELFLLADAKWKLFERKQGHSSMNKMIDFPFNISNQGVSLKSEIAKLGKKISLQDSFNKLLLDNYTPPAVLVDDKGDILYINGRTANYLELGSGEAQMNINRMAREELKYALSNAIHQARTSKSTVTIKDIKLKDVSGIRRVTLRVTGFEDPTMNGLFLILFENDRFDQKEKPFKKSLKNSDSMELEKELMFTKQQLHSTIEQMETSVEELKSTNEELQSTNEELQSTNEESLTTKEEMQSLNEELMTINMQYQSKAEELTQVNNDMKNLLDNTEIGTIFLDNQLDILRYTPQVVKLFNVIPSDVGRPITHVVSNFQLSSLEEDIKEVIEKLSPKVLQIKTKTNEWYNLRMMPYRTIDNFISGAVLTFHSITHVKILEQNLELIRKASAVLVEAIKEPALMLDQELNLVMSNSAFLKLCNAKEKSITGHPITEVFSTYLKLKNVEGFLKKLQSESGTFDMDLKSSVSPINESKLVGKRITNEDKRAEVILIMLEPRDK